MILLDFHLKVKPRCNKLTLDLIICTSLYDEFLGKILSKIDKMMIERTEVITRMIKRNKLN